MVCNSLRMLFVPLFSIGRDAGPIGECTRKTLKFSFPVGTRCAFWFSAAGLQHHLPTNWSPSATHCHIPVRVLPITAVAERILGGVEVWWWLCTLSLWWLLVCPT